MASRLSAICVISSHAPTNAQESSSIFTKPHAASKIGTSSSCAASEGCRPHLLVTIPSSVFNFVAGSCRFLHQSPAVRDRATAERKDLRRRVEAAHFEAQSNANGDVNAVVNMDMSRQRAVRFLMGNK